jgi:hypothetical protein
MWDGCGPGLAGIGSGRPRSLAASPPGKKLIRHTRGGLAGPGAFQLFHSFAKEGNEALPLGHKTTAGDSPRHTLKLQALARQSPVQGLSGYAQLLSHRFPRDTGLLQERDRARLQLFAHIFECLKLTEGVLLGNVGNV